MREIEFLNNTHKKQSPRRIALYLLSRVEQEGAFADRIFMSPRVTELEQRDRLFVRELLLGALRQKLRLDRIIETCYNKSLKSLEPGIRNILRLGLYQMMFMDSVPDRAAVNESVELAAACHGKGAGGLVNAVLRRFGREGEPALPENSVEKLSVETSHPLWLVKRWISRYGQETAGLICSASIKKHPVFIRAQSIRITAEELTSKLSEEDFETESITAMPGYLAVNKGDGLFKTRAFNEGFFTVQDPSAGMAGELLAPEPGENILDLCAAPGGKTTHCAEMMGDRGHVTALDINSQRLGLVKETVRRLGLSSIECVQRDAETFGGEEDSKYDRVLLDAPCSGTGVFSKRLDMKWRIHEEDVARLAAIQRKLLENAARLVKPDGVLVYSTCSLEPEENENIVAWFLDSSDNFSPERDVKFNDFEKGNGYLILPHRMNGTGAFAAKLKRDKNAG